MATFITYTGDGSTGPFSLTFPYLATSHVKALVDGEAATFTFVTTTTVEFDSAPENGVTIRLYRETPSDQRLVDWEDGSVIIEEDMDTADLQVLYVAEETLAAVSDKLGLGDDGNFDARELLIKGMADPVSDQDAATKLYVDTQFAANLAAAAASASAAATSAAASAASAVEAAASAATAASEASDAADSASAAAASAVLAATFEPSNFYTKVQADTLLDGKADDSHTHTKSEITDLATATDSEEGLVERADSSEIAAAAGVGKIPDVTQVKTMIDGNVPVPTFISKESMGTGATKQFSIDTSAANKVTLFIDDLSHNAGGGSQIAMRVGGAGGVVSTGYSGSGISTTLWDSYAYITQADGGGARYTGRIVLERIESGGTEWVITSELMRSDASGSTPRGASGIVDVGEALTSITFYCITGSTFFDNGFVSIKVE